MRQLQVTIKCGDCEITFQTECKLRNHRKTVHNKDNVPLMMGELNGMDKKAMNLNTSTMSEGALLHRTQQPIEQKCFVTEVRGLMDINNLLEKSSIILDLQDMPNENPNTSSFESIVDTMLNSMMAGANESVTIEELKSLIFSNNEMNMLASTVQGTIMGDGE